MKKDSVEKNSTGEGFKPGELRELVLRSIAVGLVIGGSIAFPNLPIVIGSIIKLIEEIKGFKVPEKKIRRVLNNLEKKEILTIHDKGEEAVVYLKDRNNTLILKYSLKALLEFKKKKKEWQGKWFLVFFDVPEEQRNKRDYLRKFLRSLGFYPYQKSVYLFPYECEEEIKLIKRIIEAGKYMKYVIADKIEDEEKAKIFFNLS